MKRREFSEAMHGQNLRFMGDRKSDPQRQQRVGFVLLEHFSLPAFTQALDTLITANLIREGTFTTCTFSLDGQSVTSDLGLVICPSDRLEGRHLELDLLVVCGGLRTPLRELPALTRLLLAADERGTALAGLWNGAWFLGKAGLLDGHKCAVHPENRAALAEVARNCVVTAESHIVDHSRLTSGSPTGAFNMVLEWINRLHGRELVDGIVDILAFEESRYRRTQPSLHTKLTQPLRDVLNLMSANVEEPLSTDQLSKCVGRSRRQLERLFREQLGTTPVRYYLELRITESRRLLQHSDLPIVDVALACGFVSPSHFSKCYTSFFGYRPSKEVRFGCVRSAK